MSRNDVDNKPNSTNSNANEGNNELQEGVTSSNVAGSSMSGHTTISISETVENQAEVDGVPATNASATLPDSLNVEACNNSSPQYTQQRRFSNVYSKVYNFFNRHGPFSCFFCCHVTTGTKMIGSSYALLHFLTLIVLAITALDPETISPPVTERTHHSDSFSDDSYLLFTVPQDVQAVNCTRMPCLLATQHDGTGFPRLSDDRGPRYSRSGVDVRLYLGHLFSVNELSSEGASMVVFITLCALLVTFLLLIGVYREQASHLMPFFFLQVFDFCIFSMSMVMYLTNLPSLRQIIQESSLPFKENLLAMQTNCLTLMVLLIFITIFMCKGYCINVVWRCYQYLLLQQYVPRINDGTVLRRLSRGRRYATRTSAPEHCVQRLFHDLRGKNRGAYPDPPPSYDVAMAALMTEQQTGGAPASSIVDDAPLLPAYEEAVQQMLQQQQQQRRQMDGAAAVAAPNVASDGVTEVVAPPTTTQQQEQSQQV